MEHEELAGLVCPKCGGALEYGFTAGHCMRLRRCLKEKTRTIFVGTPLKKKRDCSNAPSLKAGRCKTFKIGLFVYANH